MIKLENYEVLGWEHTIRGMRNPMNSWEKSDSLFEDADGDYYTLYGNHGPRNVEREWCVEIGPNDHDLMMRLASAGPVHGKFRRMITVYVDITAPLYWWKEFDTYKVGTVANSCSTMHRIHDKAFTRGDFSWEHLCGAEEDGILEDLHGDAWRPLEALDLTCCMLNECQVRYVAIDKKIKNKDFSSLEELEALAVERKKWWWQMIQLLPSSYNQKRTVQLNYEVLANMYEYRKAHKLDEWREFCKWIESLPYSELITCKTHIPDEGEPVKFSGPRGIVRPEEDIEKARKLLEDFKNGLIESEEENNDA